ncbi:hypothetical protein NE237_022870 [Protea cynaroides]|uniref:Uncharacterized protein n=1 Tax=Protea cynaroides TaxID=273540 RepID=A0A9Q0HAF3_9MAGN|nr:hypothetical protein NE237_022870 [Protea cynaroides]
MVPATCCALELRSSVSRIKPSRRRFLSSEVYLNCIFSSVREDTRLSPIDAQHLGFDWIRAVQLFHKVSRRSDVGLCISAGWTARIESMSTCSASAGGSRVSSKPLGGDDFYSSSNLPNPALTRLILRTERREIRVGRRMGKKKKKFIDKKKAATFQLLARDSSDPGYDEDPAGGRVFVRVDNNAYSVHGFSDETVQDIAGVAHSGNPLETIVVNDPNSIFADASGDDDDDADCDRFDTHGNQNRTLLTGAALQPDHAKREILELGLPDDGYNYLIHLREIKNTGGGSSIYRDSKAKLDQLPLDVKAYDASKVLMPPSLVDGDANENSIFTVASRTMGLMIQKAVDPEVAALLDGDDLSSFGSDVENLEEDFVVQANLPEQEEDVLDKNINSVE